MNEKINSLRLDAGISTLENDPRLVVINKNGEIIDPMIGLEKFAELIVKECINKIETYEIYVGCSPAGELACEWTYNSLKDIRDDIKEEFGLE